jgi:hypothetical protein
VCYSLWYNAIPHDVAGRWPATSSVHYTTNCITQSSAPEDGENNCPKLVERTGFINNPLFLHLDGLNTIYSSLYFFDIYFTKLPFWFV